MKHSVDVLYEKWEKTDTPERFGQWFINRYIKDSTTDAELDKAYNAKPPIAYTIIRRWLDMNNYSYDLPKKLKELGV